MNIMRRTMVSISILFTILFTISLAVGFIITGKQAYEGSGREGLKILKSIADMIEIEELQRVIESKSIEDEYYVKLEKQLTDICEDNSLLYLYTYNAKNGNGLEYGVVANSFNDNTLDTLGLEIAKYDECEEMFAAINEGTESYSKITKS